MANTNPYFEIPSQLPQIGDSAPLYVAAVVARTEVQSAKRIVVAQGNAPDDVYGPKEVVTLRCVREGVWRAEHVVVTPA